MLIRDVLEKRALFDPTKVGLVCGENRLTYRDLEHRANALAHRLLQLATQRGERVAIYLPNGPEAVIAIFAILKAGGIFTVIHPGTRLEKLAYILDNAGAAGLILTGQSHPWVPELVKRTPSLRYILTTGVAGQCGEHHLHAFDTGADVALTPPKQNCIDQDLATIIYTSGSTGFPKGVMVTHLNMVTATNSISQYLGCNPDDVILSLLPLSFDYGLYQVFLAFQAGSTLVLEKGLSFPQVVTSLMRRERVTGFPGLPSLFAPLLALEESDREGIRLRYITNTGDALTVKMIDGLRRRFPEAQIFSMYGLTECKRVAYLPPDQIASRPTSVGVAIPNTEVLILDETGRHCEAGEMGELVVRGSHVTRGYWRLPEQTARRFRTDLIPGETVLFTGDLFTRDEDGYLYYKGRKETLLKSRGFRIDPIEIENAICSLDVVNQAVVVGKPDPELGQMIVAFVVPRPGRTVAVEHVLQHCRSRLEEWLVPGQVVIRDTLPMTATGKIDRQVLMQQSAAE